jgi:hypothetical protein
MSFGFVRIRYNPVQDDQISTSNAAVLSPSLEPQVEDSIVMLGERGHYFLLSYCVFRFPDANLAGFVLSYVEGGEDDWSSSR